MNENNNIPFEDEGLEKEAPKLSGMKKAEPFHSPGGYFDSFADDLQKKLEWEELKKEAPVLAGIQKQEIFTAPAGYFDALHVQVAERIASVKESFWQKVVARMFRPRMAYTLATVAGVLLVVFFFFNPSDEVKVSSVSTLADVPKEEVDEYVHQHIVEEMTDDELAEFIAFENNQTSFSEDEQEMEEFILENVELHELSEEF